jgi:protein TonB
VIHAVVIIGVTFVSPKPHIVSKAIEVTIVNSAAKRAPENAKYFAQANQIAAGLENQKPLPNVRKKPKIGDSDRNQREVKTTTAQTVVEHRLVTRKNAPEKMVSAEKTAANQKTENAAQPQPEMSMAEIDKQIALLEAKLQHQKAAAEDTRVKSISQISAHRYVAAQYVDDWVRKVEHIGNLNIPEINGRKDFSGSVTMEVGIKADGSVYDVKILKSSGIAELDQATERIVRMMAPFTPLPPEITQELDVLSIKREWSFSNDGTLTSY